MPPVMDKTAEDKPLVTDSCTGSTSDTNDIITRYESMFASRYTAEDPAYQPYMDKGMDPPPIVENYFLRQRSNWNDNRRDSRTYEDRGHKRRYEGAGFYDNSKRQRSQYDNQDYHHHGRGWGHPQRGHHGGNQSGGQYHRHPDWRARDGHGYPPNQRGRRYDDRERGHSWGSYEARHAIPHAPPEDEWT